MVTKRKQPPLKRIHMIPQNGRYKHKPITTCECGPEITGASASLEMEVWQHDPGTTEAVKWVSVKEVPS